ncbi:Glyoxalase/Bleomycin resistance protein/Dihydroxybiphenyl dioxygenase [Trichoderma novae-zelandiae]
MPIDHTIVAVPEDKFKECLDLYAKALEPLGYQIVYQFGEYTAGLGSKFDTAEGYKPADLWIKGVKEGVIKTHIALRARDRAAVDAFHAAAISGGGTDNGAPGLREYHANYYAAFVIDAAGNNLEAVCHNP